MKNNRLKTSWGKVAGWYDEMLEEKDNTYQKNIILPNILRLMDIKKDETGLEEWISDKKSQPGPRSESEDKARKESPLFLFIEAKK